MASSVRLGLARVKRAVYDRRVRSRDLLVLGLLVTAPACRPAAPDRAAPTTSATGPVASATASPDAGTTALPRADAGVLAAPEPALRWGTRPSPEVAELYPAVDGPCAAAAVYALPDTTVVHLGGDLLLRATADGLDPDVARGLTEASAWKESWSDDVDEVGGRAGELWVHRMGAGSVFREARVLRRREGQGWKLVAPRGLERQHYTTPEAFRGGALGTVTNLDTELDSVPIGYDVAKEVAIAKLLPGDVRIRQLRALAEGDLVVAARRGETSAYFVIRPDATKATPLVGKKLPEWLSLTGRSRATFRLSDAASEKRFVIEGDAIEPEPVELAPEWRHHGTSVQRMVSAGYHEVALPRLPMTGLVPTVTDVVVAFDGEAFVTASWTGAGADKPTYRVLYRSKRPREVLRCTEHGQDGDPMAPWDPNDHWGPATTSGVEPWPPLAEPSCATPFVVAFRYRERQKVPKDFPKARAALAKGGHAVALEEVVSGSRRVVGTRAPGMEEATRIAATLVKELKATPVVVCADPEPGRLIGTDAGAR